MDPAFKLNRRNQEILDQLARLGPLRKGSLSEQYVETTLKDGSKRRRGPYTVYTFKDNKQRTVSKRLTTPCQIERYRGQIAAFRSFQELTRELAQIGQVLADREASEEQSAGKKNSSNGSIARKAQKPSAS